jgi:hypothetical protein
VRNCGSLWRQVIEPQTNTLGPKLTLVGADWESRHPKTLHAWQRTEPLSPPSLAMPPWGRARLGGDPPPTLSLFRGDTAAFHVAMASWRERNPGRFDLGVPGRVSASPSAQGPAAPGARAAVLLAGAPARLPAEASAGAALAGLQSAAAVQHLAARGAVPRGPAAAVAVPVAAVVLPVVGEKMKRAQRADYGREGAPGWCDAAEGLVRNAENRLRELRRTLGCVTQDAVERPARYACAAKLAPYLLPAMAAFALKMTEQQLLAMPANDAMVKPRLPSTAREPCRERRGCCLMHSCCLRALRATLRKNLLQSLKTLR